MDDPNSSQLYNLDRAPYEKSDLWERRPDIDNKLRLEMERIKQLDKSDKPPHSISKPNR